MRSSRRIGSEFEYFIEHIVKPFRCKVYIFYIRKNDFRIMYIPSTSS
jgi:hypothetical protein